MATFIYILISEALLIEGARRIGKSTIVETFAQHEYKSYILIDFNDCEASVKKAFDKMSDLNSFFTTLSYTYGITLHPRDSVIIFDEVQKFPKARQSVKKLVKDITIPSEETSIQMYPMDFE